MYVQEQCVALESSYIEFSTGVREVTIWLDRVEDTLRESEALPQQEQASEAEVNKYKVSTGEVRGSTSTRSVLLSRSWGQQYKITGKVRGSPSTSSVLPRS